MAVADQEDFIDLMEVLQDDFVFGGNAAAFPAAIPYGMVDVEFRHHGENCTFLTD